MLIIPGQVHSKMMGDIAANIIKIAAQRPNERFKHLASFESDGLLNAIEKDDMTTSFGFASSISSKPMKVQGCILPPPKLQYGEGRIIEPQLKGTWNLAGNIKFAKAAPTLGLGREYTYACVVTYGRSRPRDDIDRLVYDFKMKLEDESRIVGIPLNHVKKPFSIIPGNHEDLSECFKDLKRLGARFVAVLLFQDMYPIVKLAADSMCLPTQCVKWSNVTRPPKNYHTSLLIKINAKMGGINHTLASRVPKDIALKLAEEEPVFQDPPKSISWLFDEACMLVVRLVWLTKNDAILMHVLCCSVNRV